MLSQSIRQRLLENQTLDLNAAFTQARSLETAQKNAEIYTSQTAPLTEAMPITASVTGEPLETIVETTSAAVTRRPANTQLCFFCGQSRHPRSSCPARESVCNKCGKKGHFGKVCKSSASLSAALPLLATVTAGAPSCLRHTILKAHINGREVDVLIDSGSTENHINTEFAQTSGIKLEPDNTIVAMAASKCVSTSRGYCYAKLFINDSEYQNVKLKALDNLCADVVLGQEFMKLHKEVVLEFNGKLPALRVCSLASSKIEPPSLFLHLDPNCKPIVTKSRSYSKPDREFISEEISKLLKDGIIETSKSPWRAQVVVADDGRHRKRLVIDYSQTINRFTYLDAYPLPKIDDMVHSLAKYSYFSTLDLRSAYHQVPIKDEEREFTAFEANGKLYHFCRLPFGLTNAVACFQRGMDDFIEKNNLKDTYAYLDNITIAGKTKENHDNNLKNFLDAAKKSNWTFNDDKCIFSTKSVDLLGYTISKGSIKPDAERLRPLLDMEPPSCIKSLQRCLGLFAYYSQWVASFSSKALPLYHALNTNSLPLSPESILAFESLKKEIASATVQSIDEDIPFVVESDASDSSIAATLNQNGRPVAFFSRVLSDSERKHAAVEKEACAIVEALRKWRHYLTGRHFTIITDQKSVSFMFDSNKMGKIKNEKIMRWRIELSCYSYDIRYRPGSQNASADALSRVCMSVTPNTAQLKELHESLCHPGITRLHHFVRA